MDRDQILELKVVELREKLRELQLNTTGRKTTLQDRLLEHFQHEIISEEETDDDERSNTSTVRYDTEASQKRDDNVTNRDVGSESLNLKNLTPKGESQFTLRDIQNSMSYFNGSDHKEIETWVNEFNENADAVNWSDLQKYVYAKQLLKGAALKFIQSQDKIVNWESLKEALIKEFGIHLSAADRHRLLRTKKKRPNESYIEFLYSIIELGKPLNLDEESIVEYFTEGIPDFRQNKTMLYEATSIEELKQKIKIYDKINSKINSKSHEKNNFKNKDSKKQCSQCPHLSNHTTDECRKINNLCLICGGTEHKANECPKRKENNNHRPRTQQHNVQNSQQTHNNRQNTQSGQNRDPTHSINTRLCRSAIRIFKNIKIKNIIIKTQIDTGSDICLISKSTYEKLQPIKFYKSPATVIGIAQQRMQTIGYIETKLQIDDIEFKWTFHVANDEDLGLQAIIGSDVLEIVNINLSKSNSYFTFNEDCEHDYIIGRALRAICTSELQEEEEEEDKTIIDSLENLNEYEKLELKNLIRTYKPRQENEPPINMTITTTDDIPTYERTRRISLTDQKTVEDQIKEWLEKGIIRESRSQYASPIVLVSKKDGTKRLCCDYRKLNKKIVRDNFPMLLIDDALQKLQGARIFTTIDLKNGFLHVPIAENSKKFTSFVTHHGQFEFNFVPFGICNSPAVFCRFISAIFHELIFQNKITIYMDDIIIPTVTIEEGLHILAQVLNIASSYNLQINWKKCQFLKEKVIFLGYEIQYSEIRPSEEKVQAVMNYKAPKDLKSLQRFLGLTSYFRRFIENYAFIAQPLTDLLVKDKVFKFKEEESLAFKELKLALAKAPVLKIYNPNAYTEVHTDASMQGYGAVLFQKDSETQNLHPIEYMSRRTQPSERNYSSYELEVLAVIQALKKWRCYLLDKHFKIITDCNAFVGTVNKRDVPVRVSRWIIFLQDFDYEVEHRSGTRMRHVDALSRVCTLMMERPLSQKIFRAQCDDHYIKTIIEIAKQGNHPNYFLKYGILHYDRNKQLIVIPESMEKEIIQIAHKQGHFSTKKTCEIVQKQFYIKNLEQKVKKIVQSCIQCILIETKSGKKEGYLQPITKPDKPLQVLHIDHIGPLEQTKKKYNFILTIVDAFTKFTWIFATRSTTAEEVIQKLKIHAANFGHPKTIVSDRGSAFTSKIFQDYCNENNIKLHWITTGVPRENGQVERINKIIISILAKLCQEKKENWYKHTDRVQQIINSTAPRSTKVTPFKLLTGIDMNLPDMTDFLDLLAEENIENLDREREEIRNSAKENILKLQNENKKSYNKNRKKECEYKEGDLVAIKRTQFGSGLKLKEKFLGPYKITKVKRNNRYEVEKLSEIDGPNRTTTTSEFMKKW